MVADALVSPPDGVALPEVRRETVGRDKVLRLLQYFARFYSWYLLRTNATRAEIAPYEGVKKSFGQARKLLRVGKNVEHVKAAAVAFDSITTAKSGDPVLKYAALGRQLGYAGYLTADMLTVPTTLNIRQWDGAKRAGREAYRFWTIGLACSVVAQLYTLHQLRQREAKLDLKEGEGVVEAKKIALERYSSRLQLLSDLCDLTIPTSALGWTSFDDGFVGLAGTVSSLIGIIGQWKKTA
ncbi:hypothetical protein EKO27_g4596 [Xylaria grammica]|uniref:Peroxisomal biogenesis factor 11 n=1 Tax=Xylaria grammica TaxID=363999 RepID=A0A439D7Y4_9PEZI|nr:hypothetical protein EKO27_g4596 [Xylaria grammica]